MHARIVLGMFGRESVVELDGVDMAKKLTALSINAEASRPNELYLRFKPGCTIDLEGEFQVMAGEDRRIMDIIDAVKPNDLMEQAMEYMEELEVDTPAEAFMVMLKRRIHGD